MASGLLASLSKLLTKDTNDKTSDLVFLKISSWWEIFFYGLYVKWFHVYIYAKDLSTEIWVTERHVICSNEGRLNKYSLRLFSHWIKQNCILKHIQHQQIHSILQTASSTTTCSNKHQGFLIASGQQLTVNCFYSTRLNISCLSCCFSHPHDKSDRWQCSGNKEMTSLFHCISKKY